MRRKERMGRGEEIERDMGEERTEERERDRGRRRDEGEVFYELLGKSFCMILNNRPKIIS